MPFPESPRVVYENNPLKDVICQVRFPSILRIGTEPPADFQERVRREYPLFREVPLPVPSEQIPPEVAHIVKAMLPERMRATAYEFASADNAWAITLSRDSLALRSTDYRNWEDFSGRLQDALRNLSELYSPAFFSRIGLRYVNLIQRSQLGLGDQNWADLLQPYIAGEFTAPGVATNIQHAWRELRVKLEGNGSVLIRHGIPVVPENEEPCFMIDNDFYLDSRVETNDAYETLREFNGKSGQLFRWCIKPRLHTAMRPTALGT